MDLKLSLSPLAVEKMRGYLTENKNVVLLNIAPGGCSGANYDIQIVGEDELSHLHKVTEFEGIKLAAELTHLPMIQGSTIEFKDALIGGGFAVNNPNATAACGCGKSFAA